MLRIKNRGRFGLLACDVCGRTYSDKISNGHHFARRLFSRPCVRALLRWCGPQIKLMTPIRHVSPRSRFSFISAITIVTFLYYQNYPAFTYISSISAIAIVKIIVKIIVLLINIIWEMVRIRARKICAYIMICKSFNNFVLYNKGNIT